MNRGRKIELTRKGYDMSLVFPSIASVTKAVGRCRGTVMARLGDGYVLFTDQDIPVHIKEVGRG